jgi:hypothetical protein
MVDDLALIDIAIVQSSNLGGSEFKSWDSDRDTKLGRGRKGIMISISYPRFSTLRRFALKSKRLRRHAKVSPVQLRDVMRAASFSLSGLKCTVGLGKAPVLSVRDGRR